MREALRKYVGWVSAVLAAGLGWFIGGSVGIAALGTAISGSFPLAVIMGLIAWLIIAAYYRRD